MRLWSKREEEDSDDGYIPAPDGIERILEYGMEKGEVPTPVTKPAEGLILSERIEDVRVRDDSGNWVAL